MNCRPWRRFCGNAYVDVVGVCGGDEGPARWVKLKFGVADHMAVDSISYSCDGEMCSGTISTSGGYWYWFRQGVKARGKYLQRGEGRQEGLKFMISSKWGLGIARQPGVSRLGGLVPGKGRGCQIARTRTRIARLRGQLGDARMGVEDNKNNLLCCQAG